MNPGSADLACLLSRTAGAASAFQTGASLIKVIELSPVGGWSYWNGSLKVDLLSNALSTESYSV